MSKQINKLRNIIVAFVQLSFNFPTGEDDNVDILKCIFFLHNFSYLNFI